MKIKLNNVVPRVIKKTSFPSATPSSEKILIKRAARLGDVVMTLGLARFFRTLGKHVAISTKEEYKPILDNADPIVQFVKMKIENEEMYDEVFNLERVHANGKQGVVSKVDMFFAMCNIDVEKLTKDQKRPKIVPNELIIKWANNKFKQNNLIDKINVAVSIESFNPKSPRSIAIDRFVDVILTNSNVNFIILGKNSLECPKGIENLLNWTGNLPALEDLIGVVSQCDYAITIDTGLMHLAGALGKPMIAIFGPTRPNFLVDFYENVIVLDANQSCSPCWEVGCNSFCAPRVPPEMISSAFDELRNGFNGYKVLDFKGNKLN